MLAQEKVKFYFTFFFAIRGGESRTFSTSVYNKQSLNVQKYIINVFLFYL